MQKILTGICIFLLFFYFFILFFRPITAINEDLGRHLLLGKLIVQTHTVPAVNMLSYTFTDAPFINSHWLSEVVFYAVQTHTGFEGLLLFTTTLSLLTLFLIFRFLAKRFSLPVLLLPLYLAVSILSERTDIRPELFSFLFITLFITLLYRYRERATRWIFLLIPLQMLWVNMHIYFFTGILILFCFFLEHLFLKKSKRSIQLLGLTMVGALFATLCNPNGLSGALFPIMVQQNYGMPVIENQSFFYLFQRVTDSTLYYFLATCILFGLMAFLAKKKPFPADIFLFLFFAAGTFAIYRNVPLFVYATIIPFTALWSQFLSMVSAKLIHLTGKKIFQILKLYSFAIFILLILGQSAKVVQYQGVGFGLIEYNKNAVDFLLNNNLSHPLYNNFDIGGYLSYRIYPQEVFIDNRPEAYPKGFAKIAYDATYHPALFTAFDNHYNFQTIILSHWDRTMQKNPQLTFLLNSKNFIPVYLDDTTIIFVRKTTANEKIIQQHALTKDSFSLPKNIENIQLLRYYYFFEKIGWEKQKQTTYKRLLEVDPKGCLLRRGQIYLKKENVFSSFGQSC